MNGYTRGGRSVQTMAYYSATKRNGIPIPATMWMNPEHIMRSERRPRVIWFHLRELSRLGRSIKMDNRLVVARGHEKDGMGSDCFIGMGVSFGAMEKFCTNWKQMWWKSECTKCHWILPFKMVNVNFTSAKNKLEKKSFVKTEKLS